VDDYISQTARSIQTGTAWAGINDASYNAGAERNLEQTSFSDKKQTVGFGIKRHTIGSFNLSNHACKLPRH